MSSRNASISACIRLMNPLAASYCWGVYAPLSQISLEEDGGATPPHAFEGDSSDGRVASFNAI
jgi:hypothetical protein